MNTGYLLAIMIGMVMLTACAPPPRTDPLTGIVNWSELHEAHDNSVPFKNSSLGLILSDNVEQQIKSFRESLGSFDRLFISQKELDTYDFKTGADQTVQMLRRNFRKLAVINDLNECIGRKLDYCAVLDWYREVDWSGYSAQTSLQLYLFNAKAERLAFIKATSGWHNQTEENNLAGYEISEELALSRLERELRKYSP